MRTKWILNPCESVNGIKFGCDKNEIRKQFGYNYTEFKKTKYSISTTDDYGYFHVFYDKDNRMEAIEIFEEIELYIGENKIFPASYKEVKAVIDDVTIDDNELTSIKFSIGATIEDDYLSSILVGCKDYYL